MFKKNIIKLNFIIFLYLSFGISIAQSISFIGNSNNSLKQSKPLSVDQAFVSDLSNDGEFLNLIIDIKPNHYIYRDKIKVQYNNKEKTIKSLKDGKIINDDFFGETEIYEYGFSFNMESKFTNETEVKLTYQGCSKDFNLCYPPVTKSIKFSGDEKYKNNKEKDEIKDKKLYNTELFKINKIDYIKELSTTNNANAIVDLIIEYKNTPLIYIFFLALGFFIAFTPCIYPLMPIVVASTSGSKNPSIATISYIFGMVFCYTSIGLAAGLLDFNMQIIAQNSYFTYAICSILFILSIYMFGFINVILPNSTNEFIYKKMNKLNKNHNSSQFIKGFVSSLVLSPCSIAPLLGVLIFINQLGEPVFGSTLLASMGIGIGIPIFILSTSFNKFMPKNGMWMEEIKNIIGIVMISIIIYILKSEIDEKISIYLYSFVFMIYGMHLMSLNNRKKIGVILFTFFFLLSSYNINNTKNLKEEYKNTQILEYLEINTLKDLNEFIENSDRPIFIDYYADWCISCVKMDNTTLKNTDIINNLNNNYFMVKINLTDITPDKKLIMDSKKILAIPYYSIIEKNKRENIYTGEFNTAEFNEILIRHDR